MSSTPPHTSPASTGSPAITTIHPTAIVSKDCEIGEGVRIGPHCVITGRVRLGRAVVLTGSNYICGEFGPVTIGEATRLWPHASIGFEPQDYKFSGVTAGVEIGARCMIRESATVHVSTRADRATRLGDGVFMMGNTHVAHDCVIGNNVVMVNGSGFAGHCEVGDNVTMGGNAVAHQNCRIGRFVMMSGDCAINKDVTPFCIVSERNRIGGLNIVGLRRNGYRDQITGLTRAFKEYLYRPMPKDQVIAGLRAIAIEDKAPLAAEMADFLNASVRGFVTGFGKPERGAVRAGRDGGEDE